MSSRIALGVLFIAGLSSSEAAMLKFYMSATGNDALSGGTPSSAVKTLNRIHDLLQSARPTGDVEIHIRPGVYYGQTVRWTYVSGGSITFTSLDFGKVRPIFEGQGADTWFYLAVGRGIETKLRFRYLKVQNYNMAIDFHGNRNDRAYGWNGANELYGMYFYRIGGRYSHRGYSTAAVAMVNSRKNTVTNSHFVNVENHDDKASHIHALYLAHYSSANVIERNRFAEVNGDPMRTRDLSNGNHIFENDFHRAGKNYFYSDAFCESGSSNCSKPTSECPSYGNLFLYNHLYDGHYGAIGAVKPYGTDEACGPIPALRIRAFGNVRH